jgi:hypothetical protein
MDLALSAIPYNRHHAWCEACVLRWHPTILSGYCFEDHCDNCGCRAEVALVTPDPEHIPFELLREEEYWA